VTERHVFGCAVLRLGTSSHRRLSYGSLTMQYDSADFLNVGNYSHTHTHTHTRSIYEHVIS